MGLIAPKARKHLSADALFGLLRNGFSKVPDHRSDGSKMTMADALMSGFAMFSLKCPSLLDYDKQRADANLKTIYGMQCPPCDSSMREVLDPLAPETLRPSFKAAFRQLQRGKALEEMVFFKGCYLLALDGTGYFSSKKIHCQSCLEKHHRDGSMTYSHQMLGAALIHPDRREVIPLMPEPIVKQDGSEKNDCERNAAKRFVTKFRRDHPHLKVIVTEDSLSANAPHIETLHAHDMRYILGVKEGDHAFLFKQVAEAERAGRVTYYERHERHQGMHHRFRFVCGMPLNESHPSLRVNFIECWETVKGKVQHFSWVTDLRVNKGTVYRIMQGARARWRIENETFNTLKNQGYHFEHNFGHGYKNLCTVFALLMMLAFLIDQVQQKCNPLFRAAWEKKGPKCALWEAVRNLFAEFEVSSMRQIYE